jgi:ABC-2 type transport system permease protein
VTTVGVGVGTGGTGTGIERPELEAALATSFAHLYVLQTDELHRPAVTEEQLHTRARCDKGGDLVDDTGPGADWRCVVTWTLPGATATGTATYQLEVAADGRYVADGDGPKEVNGFFRINTPTGDAPNPLWQFDGVVDLLDNETKGS